MLPLSSTIYSFAGYIIVANVISHFLYFLILAPRIAPNISKPVTKMNKKRSIHVFFEVEI